MSSRFSAGAAAFAIILAAGHASAAAQDQKPSAKPQKVSGTAKSVSQIRFAPLGATVESVLLAGRQLNPALRAAALDTATAATKAAGADALDDPMISDSYQYYRNPKDFRRLARRTFRDLAGRHWPQAVPAEEAAHRARVEAMRRAREAENAKRKVEAREKVALIWQAAGTAPEDHLYLVKKGIKAHGLRVHDGALAVPMRDGEELHSLQFIGPEGDKRFLSGGRVNGCYVLIGRPGGTLCIVEGYATGASIHEAAGCAVAVAFNDGNLLPVARTLRAKFPDLRLIVCADDDACTPGKPGLSKAREAAQAVGALLAVPDFGKKRPDGATDFNDLHRHAGSRPSRPGDRRWQIYRGGVILIFHDPTSSAAAIS